MTINMLLTLIVILVVTSSNSVKVLQDTKIPIVSRMVNTITFACGGMNGTNVIIQEGYSYIFKSYPPWLNHNGSSLSGRPPLNEYEWTVNFSYINLLANQTFHASLYLYIRESSRQSQFQSQFKRQVSAGVTFYYANGFVNGTLIQQTTDTQTKKVILLPLTNVKKINSSDCGVQKLTVENSKLAVSQYNIDNQNYLKQLSAISTTLKTQNETKMKLQMLINEGKETIKIVSKIKSISEQVNAQKKQLNLFTEDHNLKLQAVSNAKRAQENSYNKFVENFSQRSRIEQLIKVAFQKLNMAKAQREKIEATFQKSQKNTQNINVRTLKQNFQKAKNRRDQLRFQLQKAQQQLIQADRSLRKIQNSTLRYQNSYQNSYQSNFRSNLQQARQNQRYAKAEYDNLTANANNLADTNQLNRMREQTAQYRMKAQQDQKIVKISKENIEEQISNSIKQLRDLQNKRNKGVVDLNSLELQLQQAESEYAKTLQSFQSISRQKDNTSDLIRKLNLNITQQQQALRECKNSLSAQSPINCKPNSAQTMTNLITGTGLISQINNKTVTLDGQQFELDPCAKVVPSAKAKKLRSQQKVNFQSYRRGGKTYLNKIVAK